MRPEHAKQVPEALPNTEAALRRHYAFLERGVQRPSLARAMRELAEGYAASQQPDSVFDPNRLHWRNDRLEFAFRVGLGPWLIQEFARDRAFLSPIP